MEERTEEVHKLMDKVFEALKKDDYAEAQRIFDKEVETKIDVNDRALWRAVVLRYSQRVGDTEALKRLVELSEKDGGEPRVIKQLAYSYKETSEYKKAREKFLLAKDKYDVNDEKQRTGIVGCYIQASWCMAFENDNNGALNNLRELLFDNNLKDHRASILNALARISQDKADIEQFFTYAEEALDDDPSNTKLRFSLAYEYSNNNNNNLALLHYKKLTDMQTNYPYGQNNLGVTYEHFGLSGKSVERYLRAAEYKETLPMSNIAKKYLNGGFTENAQKMIDKANALANEGVEVDYRVGEAQKRLNDLMKEENKKEKEILLEAEKERKFRVCYAKAFCSEETIAKEEIEGNWETPWSNGQLTFNEEANYFEIDISFKEADPFASLVSALSGSQGKQEEVYKTVHHNIKGHVNNLSGRYTVDEKEAGTTIMTKGVEYAATGYMVIEEGSNSIDVMEKTKDGKNEFKQWKKLKN